MFDKLIDVLLNWIKLFRIFVVVPQYDKIAVLRWGNFNRIAGPGPVWMIPLKVDEPYTIPMYLQTKVIGPQSLVTKDGKEIVVSTLVTHTVSDPKAYLLSIQGGEQAIQDLAYGVVAQFIMEHTWEDIQSGDAGKRLLTLMRQRADDYGVKIHRTQLVDLTKSRSLRLIGHIANSGVL